MKTKNVAYVFICILLFSFTDCKKDNAKPNNFIAINFSGSGASILVDSVRVENMMKCESITLKGSDTLRLRESSDAKNTKSNSSDLVYTTGDLFMFVGYSEEKYVTISILKPTKSETVAFSFTPCEDADGNCYPVVQIGTQLWMAENLKTVKYRNGDIIQNISNGWTALSTGAYCNYNNDQSNSALYGKLYNWYAINDRRSIAPVGWHIPSNSEWDALCTYLGGVNVSGGKLKSKCPSLWNSPNLGGTNESGFNSLPGGFRDANGIFMEKGTWATYWYSISMDQSTAYALVLFHDDDDFGSHYANKVCGLSVRCIKD